MALRCAAVLVLGLALCPGVGCTDSAHAPPPLADAAPPADVVIESDDGEEIVDWLLTVSDGARESFLPTLADIIRNAAPDVRFHIFFSGRDPGPEIARELGPERLRDLLRVHWIPVTSPLSWWTRDFFVGGRAGDGTPVAMLHHPDHYETVQAPVSGSGPELLATLRRQLAPRTLDTDSRLEGGAVVAGKRHVFITPTVCETAIRDGNFRDRGTFLASLRRLYGRPIVVLDVPSTPVWAHADLFLTPLGSDTLLLGDSLRAARLLTASPPAELARFTEHIAALGRRHEGYPGFARMTPALLSSWVRDRPDPVFGRLLRQLTDLGYRVDSLPWLSLGLPGYDYELRFSYNNVVMERRAGRRTVYLPRYDIAALDRAARSTWERHGCRVVEIEALGPALYGGSVRCLSQVFRR